MDTGCVYTSPFMFLGRCPPSQTHPSAGTLGWQGVAGEALGAEHVELLGTEVLGWKRSRVTLNKGFLVLS